MHSKSDTIYRGGILMFISNTVWEVCNWYLSKNHKKSI